MPSDRLRLDCRTASDGRLAVGADAAGQRLKTMNVDRDQPTRPAPSGEQTSLGLPAGSLGQLLHFPTVPDRRGNLSFIEGSRHVPFEIKRVFYLYDVPGGETRAGHALRDVDQVLIAMSGSFDVVVDNGANRQTVTLNRSYFGLFIPSLVWRELENFSSGAVCLVLASEPYDENAYYRSYPDFLAAIRHPTR